MLSQYDKENMLEIINGRGDWFTAHVIRFIDKVWWKADNNNKIILRTAFSDVVEAYEEWHQHYMWDEPDA